MTDPRLAAAVARLQRAMDAARSEDRAFVLDQLELLARRFDERARE